MQPVRIPRSIDDSRTLLLWRADELMPFALAMALGFFFNRPFIFGLVGIGLMVAMRRFTAARPRGYLLHALYWYGLVPLRGASIPHAFARRVLP